MFLALCRLVEDTAWHPVMKEEVEEWGNGPKGAIFKFFLGTPLKLWASVGHWALWHFDISKFTQKQRARVRSLEVSCLRATCIDECTSSWRSQLVCQKQSGIVRCPLRGCNNMLQTSSRQLGCPQLHCPSSFGTAALWSSVSAAPQWRPARRWCRHCP